MIRFGPDDLAGLQTLVGEGGSSTDTETLALSLFREGLAARLRAGAAGAVAAEPAATPGGRPGDASSTSVRTRLLGKGRVRSSILVAAVLLVAVLLVGGYGQRWSWTGFNGNDQLWDWMNLLLLPIALATFPLWLMYADHMSRARKTVLGVAVLAFAGFVAIGYLAPLEWTGFQGNTLWSWFSLILLPVAIVTASAWPASKRRLRTRHVVVISGLLLGWLVTVIGGYAGGWSWTGYPGNTLWDWMTLLLGPIAFSTILIPGAVRWLSGDVARQVAEEERKRSTVAAESSREQQRERGLGSSASASHEGESQLRPGAAEVR
jgi:hypothetical protein